LLLAAVEGIASAENLGAVVRNCAAFGAHFLIVGETCGSPFQRRAVAGSMGTIFEQPLVRADNLVETLTKLRARGVRCLAAHPRPGAKKLSSVDLQGDCCLVFGAEGPGLTASVLAACDDAVEIPMPSHMNSLNVAVAAGVFLYGRPGNAGESRVFNVFLADESSPREIHFVQSERTCPSFCLVRGLGFRFAKLAANFFSFEKLEAATSTGHFAQSLEFRPNILSGTFYAFVSSSFDDELGASVAGNYLLRIIF
jgi:tRNA(Leu) C34 or U34 (ribose-2'-O)-methylase TrmL